jgi:hypothetical protein
MARITLAVAVAITLKDAFEFAREPLGLPVKGTRRVLFIWLFQQTTMISKVGPPFSKIYASLGAPLCR